MHSDLLIRAGADRHSELIRQATAPHRIHESEQAPANRRVNRLWQHLRRTRPQRQPSAQPVGRPAIEG